MQCAASCPSNDTIRCLQPSDCQGNQACCETVALGGGQAPMCAIAGVSSECRVTCTTLLLPACTGTDTLRLCAQGSDCNDPTSPSCCMLNQQYVCVGQQLASNLQCM